MFARLLCSVVRAIEQGHRWYEEYPFDDTQRIAAGELSEAIESGQSDEADAAAVAVWFVQSRLARNIREASPAPSMSVGQTVLVGSLR